MVVLDLFGIHASGKTTTIRALESYCDIELPIADNEKRAYVTRNLLKFRMVLKVVFRDPFFSMKMLRMIWRKKGWHLASFKRWYNINYRGYFYFYEQERRIVLGGGILHKLWNVYGASPIELDDQRDILAIVGYFQCQSGYYLDEPIDVIRERNINRGKNTLLERRIDELEFFYENFYEFVKVLEDVIEIRVVQGKTVEERVDFLRSNCEKLQMGKD